MSMPALSIPQFPIPFHIPFQIHPCVVHLAIALPIVIILMEVVNLVAKKRALGVFSFGLMILLALILFVAYLTGSVDAEHAKNLLNGEAKSLFEAHRLQGIYLVYGAAVLVLIKLLSVLVRKTAMRVTFLLFLLLFTALTLNTAKKGKELVFDYGINVKTSSAKIPQVKEPSAEVSAPKEAEEAKVPESGKRADMKASTPQKTAPGATTPKVEAAVQEAEEKPAGDAAPEASFNPTEEPAKKAIEEPAAETSDKTEAAAKAQSNQ